MLKRKIKVIDGNGTASAIIRVTPGMRCHGLLVGLTHTGGTNTVSAVAALLTIRAKRGNENVWELSGTELNDFLLLHGQGFTGLPNTKTLIQIPFSPKWLFDTVSDALAWNPADGKGDITVEISTASQVFTLVAYEFVDYKTNVRPGGMLTLEVVSAAVGSTSTTLTQPTIEARGRLVQASIYPDSGATNEITPAGLTVGRADEYVHELLTSAENDEDLESYGKTPAASGRTANIYDMLFVNKSDISQAPDLGAVGSCKLEIRAASAMSGTAKVLLARVE